MQRIGYSVTLNLGEFYGAEIEEREVDGMVEEVVVIPLRLNGLKKSKKYGCKGLYVSGKAYPTDYNVYNQSHYLMMIPPICIQQERKELGYRPAYIIGNMTRIFSTEDRSKPANIDKLNKLINNITDYDSKG